MTPPFVKLPVAVVHAAQLSFGARIAYGSLLRRAWLAGRRDNGDGVRLPALNELAVDVGASRTSFKNYLAELRSEGFVITTRPDRTKAQIYFLFDAPATPEQVKKVGQIPTYLDAEVGQDSDLPVGRDSDPPREVGQSLQVVDKDLEKTFARDARVCDPPTRVRIEGRDLPLDALCEVCGIDQASPRIRAAASALNGPHGIREQFWVECQRRAEDSREMMGKLIELAADPELFERLLASRVHLKAAAIRNRDSWRSSLTPHIVRDLWLDIDHRAPGHLTADDIDKAFARATNG